MPNSPDNPFEPGTPSPERARRFKGVELWQNPQDLSASMLLAADNTVLRDGMLYVRPGMVGMFGGNPPSSFSSSSGSPSSSSSASPSSSSSGSSQSSSASSGISSSSSSGQSSSSSSAVSSSSSSSSGSPSSSSSSSGGFSPPSLANLVLWLDASQIPGLSDGNSVSTWTDLSALAASYTPDATQSQVAPIYKTAIQNGKPIVRFANSTAGLRSTTLPFTAGDYSIFIVFNPTSAGSGAAWVPLGIGVNAAPGGASGMLNYLSLSLQSNEQYNGVANYSFGTYPSAMSSLEFILSGSTLSSWISGTVNGSPTTVGAYATPANQATLGSYTWMGAGGPNTTNSANMDIAEIIVYNRALSSGERAQIEGYLSAKWAI